MGVSISKGNVPFSILDDGVSISVGNGFLNG